MKNILPVINKDLISNKTVFLRLDLDVPFKNEKIQDESRLIAGLKTLEFLLNYSKKIIICGHRGRPIGFDKNFSLKPIAEWFKKRFKISDLSFQMEKKGEFLGWEIGEKIFLLENIRFYEEEEKPLTSEGLKFSRKLANLAEVYVNDAFAVSHRYNASVTGVPRYLPHFSGFNLSEEFKNLSIALTKPKHPLVVIIGGAKIETKFPLIEKMIKLADYVLVGGKIALEKEKINAQENKIFVAESNKRRTDLSENDIACFKKLINEARMIIWNGPVGIVEEKNSRKGTEEIAKAIVKKDVFSIIGGGDTIDFVKKLGLINKFSFVSTGGGAMLSFLAGEKMPGIEALER